MGLDTRCAGLGMASLWLSPTVAGDRQMYCILAGNWTRASSALTISISMPRCAQVALQLQGDPQGKEEVLLLDAKLKSCVTFEESLYGSICEMGGQLALPGGAAKEFNLILSRKDENTSWPCLPFSVQSFVLLRMKETGAYTCLLGVPSGLAAGLGGTPGPSWLAGTELTGPWGHPPCQLEGRRFLTPSGPNLAQLGWTGWWLPTLVPEVEVGETQPAPPIPSLLVPPTHLGPASSLPRSHWPSLPRPAPSRSRHIKAPRPGLPTSTRRGPASARPSRGPGRGDGGGWCRSSRAPAPSPTVQTVAAAILTARPFPPDCDYRDTRRPGPAAHPGPANHPGAALVTSASPHFCLRKGFSELRHAPGAWPGVIGGGRRSDWTAPGLAPKLLVPMHAFQHPLDFPAI
ncbi:uncharacterized protein [Symphalangus syndactylus]|uniref:uncharacterized protein n=1 Tax=Symphalangus syndactylus TaxID=9590 RepID=UPI0024435C99|nr:uncharacterized protein LOC129460192 [Symphalangus syndactylus]